MTGANAMSSITKQQIGQYTYLYESTSYWDTNAKRADNIKRSIGRIDNATGETFYKQYYIDKLKREGKPTSHMRIWIDGRRVPTTQRNAASDEKTNLAHEVLGTVKDYGVAYLLKSIAIKSGLLEHLEAAFPQCWQKIFILACYLVASNNPVMYCSDWTESNECLDAGSMSSQRISELLTSFGYKERSDFYARWYSHIRENEYIALDITSVSSYSQNIDFMEWGHNRDGDRLPQVNICMLFGESSMLPIYQALYSGSLRDVSTLEATLAEFSALADAKEICLVMDKGFYSVKNVNVLLGKDKSIRYKFLLPVSFTTAFAKNCIAEERDKIDCIENVVLTSGSPIRGVYRLLRWGNNSTELHTHVYFNPEKALKDRNELYDHVTRLKTKALKNPNDKRLKNEFLQYLVIEKSEKSGLSVIIRHDVIAKKLETTGWFVLISNHIENTQTAYDMYRAKDIVEKSFFQYKNSLGLHRLHVHSDERVLNKTFVAFIALIISSHIHKVMREKQLYKHMSFDKLLNILAKLKVAYVKGKMVLRPLTMDQKLIFDCFGIEHPLFSCG
jgi:transposase